MENRACVFVDGENLRHSLLGVFKEDAFSDADYLPPKADWSTFFDWVVSEATNGKSHRLRTYWFVIEKLAGFPYRLNKLGEPEKSGTLKSILSRYEPFRQELNGLADTALTEKMEEQLSELKSRQQKIDSRFSGWIVVQDGIAMKHRSVEFRRSGVMSYDLFQRRLGKEKSVDIKLACDMIMLRDIYDTAIIVSGDQDYVPAAQILKDAGKTVINVAFMQRNGKLLPGGARQLNIISDSSYSVPYDRLKSYMGLD